MGYDTAAIMGGLYGDGYIALKGAFDREWVAVLGEDAEVLLGEALARPGGAVGRGPKRWHVEVHPERLRGFVDLVTHPWLVAVSEAVLGPDYRIVGVGFDIPLPGAVDQPWHRDVPASAETLVGRRLDSLAFNVTTVDVFEHMGPSELAPGTQWDDPASFEGGMFPPRALWGRYKSRAQRRLPMMGDISARSPLVIHRGTANRSSKPRPVLVLHVAAPTARNAERHDLQLTRAAHLGLPDEIRRHLAGRVVDTLEPIAHGEAIERLMAGEG